jgi:hypothetical protein
MWLGEYITAGDRKSERGPASGIAGLAAGAVGQRERKGAKQELRRESVVIYLRTEEYRYASSGVRLSDGNCATYKTGHSAIPATNNRHS